MRVTPRDANYTGPGSRFCILRPELITAFCHVRLIIRSCIDEEVVLNLLCYHTILYSLLHGQAEAGDKSSSGCELPEENHVASDSVSADNGKESEENAGSATTDAELQVIILE